jgi:hypothetical protein
MKALQKENIQVVLRQNDKGVIYGITYVDHRTKCVFNGSHLGKRYSATLFSKDVLMNNQSFKKNNHFNSPLEMKGQNWYILKQVCQKY